MAWINLAEDVDKRRLFWTRWWTLGIRKARGISWQGNKLFACQEVSFL